MACIYAYKITRARSGIKSDMLYGVTSKFHETDYTILYNLPVYPVRNNNRYDHGRFYNILQKEFHRFSRFARLSAQNETRVRRVENCEPHRFISKIRYNITCISEIGRYFDL